VAAITDPRAVVFSNNYLRPFADLMNSVYSSAVIIQQVGNTQTMENLIPFVTDAIADSASPDGLDAVGGDGRPIMIGQDYTRLIAVASAIQSYFERGTVDGSGAVNNANLNSIQAKRVNGRPIF
jgi:hypothetical protein